MGTDSSIRVWVYSIPVWLCGVFLAGTFWAPAHYAIHNGQVTPLLCAILALGMGRKPLFRGVCVGLVCAVKPVFLPLVPFVSIAFGWSCALGIVLGGSVALFPPSWSMEYSIYIRDIAERPYSWASLINHIGTTASMVIISIPSLYLSLFHRQKESTYVLLIAITTIGTALWPHSYTPLIIPICYYAGYICKKYSPENANYASK